MTANPPSALNLSPPQNGLVVTDSPERSLYSPRMKGLTEYNSLDPAPAAPSFEGIPESCLLPDGYPDYLRMILTSRVYEITQETQLTLAGNLSAKLGVRVVLKREDLHPVFSFKIRGAYNKMAHIPEEERWKGVVACSAGNHAQGVAYSARQLSIPSTIVMPLATPSIKHQNVSRLGSKVLLHGQDFDEAKAECHRLQKLHGLIDIPPYDDPYVIAGQGTIGMELLRQTNPDQLQVIFACVGGGGLVSGIASYVKRIAPHVKVIGVETYDACAMKQSLEKGERVVLPEVGLFADGAAVRVVGEETFRICTSLLDDVILVDTDEICAAIKDVFEGTPPFCFLLIRDTRSILEPAGALAVAGLKKYLATNPPPVTPVDRRTSMSVPTYACILSGANMNFSRLRFIAERSLLGGGTEILFTVLIPERPGTFLQLVNAVLPLSVTEYSYRYNDPETAAIYISFAVTDRERQKAEVTAAWDKLGFQWEDISGDEMAKSHGRYLVGGIGSGGEERLYRFEFPERPGSLQKFLIEMRPGWNISLFHYRNHGHDVGKILAGIQVPDADQPALEEYLKGLGYPFWDETENTVYKRFLKKNDKSSVVGKAVN